MWENIGSFISVGDIVQILIIWLVFYYIFLFIKGTRGAQVLIGLALLIAILIGVTYLFNLNILFLILLRFSQLLGLSLLIIFQPEIRRALAELGKQPGFAVTGEKRNIIDNVVQAVEILSEHKIGGLIAIEREIGTRAIQESGININARITPELLSSIFFPHTPLHDGGVILSGNRIVAASCVFPLSQSIELHKTIGTRHRAAVGLSEETDAVVIIISEETGTISVAYRGRLSRGHDSDRLKRFLTSIIMKGRIGSPWQRAQEQLDLTPEGIAKSENLSDQENNGGK